MTTEDAISRLREQLNDFRFDDEVIQAIGHPIVDILIFRLTITRNAALAALLAVQLEIREQERVKEMEQ